MSAVNGIVRCTGTDSTGALSSVTVTVTKFIEGPGRVDDYFETLSKAGQEAADAWGLRNYMIDEMQIKFSNKPDEAAVFHLG